MQINFAIQKDEFTLCIASLLLVVCCSTLHRVFAQRSDEKCVQTKIAVAFKWDKRNMKYLFAMRHGHMTWPWDMYNCCLAIQPITGLETRSRCNSYVYLQHNHLFCWLEIHIVINYFPNKFLHNQWVLVSMKLLNAHIYILL